MKSGMEKERGGWPVADSQWPVAGDWRPVVDKVEGVAADRRGQPDDPTRNCSPRCTRLL
jgi:hypothetical protein